MPCSACDDERYVLGLGRHAVRVPASTGVPLAWQYKQADTVGRVAMIWDAGMNPMQALAHYELLTALIQRVDPRPVPCPFCFGR